MTATGGPRSSRPTSTSSTRSLRANEGARIADGRLADLRRRVELFGFHVAKLDVRFHVAELAERSARVAEALGAVAEAQGRLGERAVDTVIVSGTESAADVLAAVDLAAEAGARMSPVPLFETIRDLDEAPAIVESLLDEPRFAALVEGARPPASRSWLATPTRARTAAT